MKHSIHGCFDREETTMKPALRVGIGGPVGAGKTTLVDALCKRMRGDYEIAVVTNDIYTQEDAQILVRSQALSEDRIVGVETGGCPHTAIREDASMNMVAIENLTPRFPELMEHDARKMRGAAPFVFTNLLTGQGLDEVIGFVVDEGVLTDNAE